MTTALQRLSEGTIELTITIPWTVIQSSYEDHIKHTANHAQVSGFRKGKAPKKLIEDKLDKTNVYEDVIRDILPKVYSDAITEQKLKPILVPKIELREAKEGADWVIRALTCEKPAVALGDYKKAITDLKTSKKQKIWTPGQGEQSEQDKKDKQDKVTIDELLQALFTAVTISLPSLLVEHEVNRLLSELIDQTKKLGLTVEQYLASTSRTAESMRKEYDEQARRTLILEFALEDIADKESIFVSDDDIDTVIKSAKSDDERKTLTEQRYYIASVLRRQKTIDFLSNL